MTDDRTLDRAARSWLEEGPTRAPERSLADALARIQTTRQDRDLAISWRLPPMFNNRLAGAVLAAVLIVAAGGLALISLTRPGSVGPPATPSASALPSPTEIPAIAAADIGRTLPAGSYRIEGFAVPFRVTLPAGWGATDLSTNSVSLAYQADQKVNVTFAIVDQVYPDPCHPTGLVGGTYRIGGGVNGLVEALSSVKGFELTALADVTVGGASGKTFLFGNDIDVEAQSCSGNPLPFATYERDGQPVDIAMFAGERDQFWVLDAAGTRLFIAVTENQLSATEGVRSSLRLDE